MSAELTRDEHWATVAGATLGTIALFLLLAAPIGVLLGGNALELGVVAIAGAGVALLHLAVVVGLAGRSVALEVRRGVGR